jgi:hypothetical protein
MLDLLHANLSISIDSVNDIAAMISQVSELIDKARNVGC